MLTLKGAHTLPPRLRGGKNLRKRKCTVSYGGEACFGKNMFLTIVNIKVGFLPPKKFSFQINAQQIG